MKSGEYKFLKLILKAFDATISSMSVGSSRPASDQDYSEAHQVDEDNVMQQFGQALKQVANIRDTYATSACDICKQLRNLAPLDSYANQKGYNSDSMRDTLDMQYRYRRQEEDFDEFLDNIQICKYCAVAMAVAIRG